MRPINEAAEIIRLAIESRRREEIHTVITPTETARELRDWHDLQHRDTERSQLRQFVHRARPGAFARKGANVHLIDDLPLQRNATPCPIGPVEPPGVDDLRRAMRTIGLEARGGIRIQGVAVIEPKTVARPHGCGGDMARKIARCFRGQGDSLRIVGTVSLPSFEHDLYSPAARCPHAEMYTAFRQCFRSDGKLPRLPLLAHTFFSFHCSADARVTTTNSLS